MPLALVITLFMTSNVWGWASLSIAHMFLFMILYGVLWISLMLGFLVVDAVLIFAGFAFVRAYSALFIK
jgi:hypothetical protein